MQNKKNYMVSIRECPVILLIKAGGTIIRGALLIEVQYYSRKYMPLSGNQAEPVQDDPSKAPECHLACP